MSSRSRAGGACVVVFATVLLSVAGPVPALAASCPNAQLRSGPSERLPDCRAYEQVSPVEKGGLDAISLAPMLPAQASACEGAGTCAIAYMNTDTGFAGAAGNELDDAYLASRGTDGWQTTALSPPTLD